MLRKQVDPKIAAVATLVVLAAIQLFYWRGLVYKEPMRAPIGGGGGGAGPRIEEALGREDVVVETFAGDEPGFRDGPPALARFCGPNALALLADGGLLVADSRNHRIRRVAPTGRVTTEAGSGAPGGPGGRADGPAAAAQFRFPSGVSVAPDGTVYVADTGNHRICRLKEGRVTTLAGGVEGSADGRGEAACLNRPATIVWGPDGALWVADSGNRATRRIDTAGSVTTPGAVPEVVAAALGDQGSEGGGAVVWASPEARGWPEATNFTAGRFGPAASALPSLLVVADVDYHTLLALRPGEPPLLISGRRRPE